jgi:hypothetical protein
MLFLIVGIVYERRHTRNFRIRRPDQSDAGVHDCVPDATLAHVGECRRSTDLSASYDSAGLVSDVVPRAVWCSVGTRWALRTLWLFQRTMGRTVEKNKGPKTFVARNCGVHAVDRPLDWPRAVMYFQILNGLRLRSPSACGRATCRTQAGKPAGDAFTDRRCAKPEFPCNLNDYSVLFISIYF